MQYTCLKVRTLVSLIPLVGSMIIGCSVPGATQGTQQSVENQALMTQVSGESKALYDQGVEAALVGDYHQAIAFYDQALTAGERHADLFYNRGVANYTVGNIRQAQADFDEAIHLDPSHAEAFGNRCFLKLEMRDRDGALADCRQSGKLFAQRQDYQQAQQIEQWIEANFEMAETVGTLR